MGNTQTVSGYNYLGNPISITDRNGNTISYQYGVFGIEKVSSGDDEQTTQYNTVGQVTSVSSKNADGTVETKNYTYDDFGRIVSETSNGVVQNYSYDLNSNLIGYSLKRNYQTLNNTNYTYDKINRLTQMSVDGIITSYTYDANSQLTSKTVSNGLETSYDYNKAGLIVNMVNKKGEDIYNNYTSTYTLNGLKKSETEAGVQTKTYQYDKLGRLTNEHVTNAENAVVLNNSFTYDNFGNRATMTNGSSTNTYTYDANNRLLKAVKTENNVDEITNYIYDNNGNQIAWYKGSISPNSGTASLALTDETDGTDYGYYTYDAFNRLSNYTNGVTNASYTYGADNLRKSKTVDGVTTNYTWNGSDMVLEEKGTQTNRYYYGADGIAFANLNGTTNYYQKNAHGDITALTNANGTITKNYQFDAFGNELTNNANDINPFRYAGEYLDNETGLIYLRNRYYDSNNGRFITEDPIKDGLNWYAYCGNNPVIFVDPMGLYKLYHEGNDTIYAQIEEGDTLSKVALSEVNDVNAWKKINYIGDYNNLKIGQIINITDIYNEQYPLSGAIKYSMPIEYPYTAIQKPDEVSIINVDFHFGVGLAADVNIQGAKINLGAKSYYSFSDIIIKPSITSEISAQIDLFDYVGIGLNGYTKIDTYSQEVLKRGGYAGIMVGDKIIGLDALSDGKDFKLMLGAGLYLGAGGELNIEFNLSELYRRIYK